MKAMPPLIALSAALALAACSKKGDAPEATASTSAVAETADMVPLAPPIESEAAPASTPEATPTPDATPSPTSVGLPTSTKPSPDRTVATTEIPASIRGRWGMVPRDCTSKLGDAKGLLTVSAGQLKFYEAVAKLGKIKQADDSRIRATFKYSGEGQTWTQDVVLDVTAGGKTMVRRDYGPDALPGPQKYTRCT